MSNLNSDVRASLVKYAANILNRRPYFRHKLREKLLLRQKKLKITGAEPVIESILNDLSKSGYLNDAYLADAFVRRQLDKGYGPRIIAYKLKLLRLDPDVIKNSLENEAYKDKQITALIAFSSKFPRLDRRKLVQKLYQRGFDSYLINKLFDSPYFGD